MRSKTARSKLSARQTFLIGWNPCRAWNIETHSSRLEVEGGLGPKHRLEISFGHSNQISRRNRHGFCKGIFLPRLFPGVSYEDERLARSVSESARHCDRRMHVQAAPERVLTRTSCFA